MYIYVYIYYTLLNMDLSEHGLGDGFRLLEPVQALVGHHDDAFSLGVQPGERRGHVRELHRPLVRSAAELGRGEAVVKIEGCDRIRGRLLQVRPDQQAAADDAPAGWHGHATQRVGRRSASGGRGGLATSRRDGEGVWLGGLLGRRGIERSLRHEHARLTLQANRRARVQRRRCEGEQNRAKKRESRSRCRFSY